MMREAICVALFLALGCSSPPPEVDDRSGGPLAVVASPPGSPAPTLGAAYAAYAADTGSAAKQRVYFDAFPADLAALKNEFGFEEVGPDSIALAQYYEQGDEMIGAFFRLGKLPSAEVAAKAVGIARNGVWQEDGVNYFLHYLAERFEREPDVFLTAIKALSPSDQAGFWKFYVDGPEAYPKEERSRLRSLLAKEPHQLALVDSVLALPRTGH